MQMHSLFDATLREGLDFAKQFFTEIDSGSSPPKSIIPETKIVWNGTPLAGTPGFSEMIARSPKMSHELQGLDVQPFPNGDKDTLNMLVNTAGTVRLGFEPPEEFTFSAQFVVRRPQPKAPLVLHTLGYRLVHHPANSKVLS